MATVLLVCVVILVIAALVFGIVSLLTGEDPGLAPVEPDGRALPLPNHRSLTESDLKSVRFDVTLRGYRMAQVDRALRRTAYDVGYKDEMIAVLEAEVAALREGRLEDADLLRKAREAAASTEPSGVTAVSDETDETDETDEAGEASENGEEGEGAPDSAEANERVDEEESVDEGAASTPVPEAVEPPGHSASTKEPAVDEAGPSTEEAGSTGEAGDEAVAGSTEEAGDEAEATSADEAEKADRGDAAERPANVTAPAARSAPKKSTKRAARA
jgi:DivIVA domain-containing protein